ncbi:hypothetical protein BC828DRAFT_216185 [Blastocladiella britannica]|nr:hypothetical protein BC828DRAFT_216185 [Blastocladiella britannica]
MTDMHHFYFLAPQTISQRKKKLNHNSQPPTVANHRPHQLPAHDRPKTRGVVANKPLRRDGRAPDRVLQVGRPHRQPAHTHQRPAMHRLLDLKRAQVRVARRHELAHFDIVDRLEPDGWTRPR